MTVSSIWLFIGSVKVCGDLTKVNVSWHLWSCAECIRRTPDKLITAVYINDFHCRNSQTGSKQSLMHFVRCWYHLIWWLIHIYARHFCKAFQRWVKGKKYALCATSSANTGGTECIFPVPILVSVWMSWIEWQAKQLKENIGLSHWRFTAPIPLPSSRRNADTGTV